MITPSTRRVFLVLALSAICFTSATEARADFNIVIGPGGIKIGGGGKKQPPRTYAVTLYRPRELGGGVVTSARGLTYEQALNFKSQLQQRHWVIWKYAGVGKPYHSRMFYSYTSANTFLKNKGPAKEANKLGIAILAKQYIARGQVTMN